jgi:solute:Na+ symporter, SSS family
LTATLAPLDWAIIVAYLLLTLIVGVAVSGRASTGMRSYFQADGTLPWWWAGTSIAATTFAADTPLAITGLVASGGLSNNWMWLSWAALHVAVACFFADRWQRSGMLTDAELVSVRYSGVWTPRLRVLKALIYGCLINAIILGWVVRAMSTIVAPYVDWRAWAPGLVDVAAALLPAGHALGEPGTAITIVLLTLVVAIYSSAGGLRGVVLTDLLQFALALVGAAALAWVAVRAAGGLAALAAVTTLSGLNATSMGPSALAECPISGGRPDGTLSVRAVDRQ